MGVRELAGSKVNIIWGTVTAESYDADKIVVTLIATGMVEEKKESFVANKTKVVEHKNQEFKQSIYGKEMNIEIPVFYRKQENARR